MYKVNVRLSQNLKKTKNSPVYIYYEIDKILSILIEQREREKREQY